MAELSEEEKQYLVGESVHAIVNISKLHNIDYLTLPVSYQKLLVSVFIAGAAMVINQTRKEKHE